VKLPFKTHNLPGVLIAVEGVSRAGKSTFINQYLENTAREITFVQWNAFPPSHQLTTHLKKEALLDGWSFCLAHLLDYYLTYSQTIIPALNAGKVVITDRYLYTSWVRDTIRGIPEDFLLSYYQHFIRPDYTFYLSVSYETVRERYRITQSKFGRYGTGQDIFPGATTEVAFLRYYNLQIAKYEQLIEPNGFIIKDHHMMMSQILAETQNEGIYVCE
jgi:dTMP kinase